MLFVLPLLGLLKRAGLDGPFSAPDLTHPVLSPGPRLPGPADEPDDIETWYARPQRRRRRRRRLALATAVLTAAAVCAGTGLWPSPAPPSSPGRAYTPHRRDVITQARARQRRRRRRIALAAAPVVAATGAPVKLLPKSAYQFAVPCAVASDRGHVWVANCGGDSVTEFPA